MSFLPHGLLARASYYRLTEQYCKAHQDLVQRHDIAQASDMRLHLCDYHLEMAFLRVAQNEDPSEHLQAAHTLIMQTGYRRRLPQLAALSK